MFVLRICMVWNGSQSFPTETRYDHHFEVRYCPMTGVSKWSDHLLVNTAPTTRPSQRLFSTLRSAETSSAERQRCQCGSNHSALAQQFAACRLGDDPWVKSKLWRPHCHRTLESWLVRGIIPAEPYFRFVNCFDLPRSLFGDDPLLMKSQAQNSKTTIYSYRTPYGGFQIIVGAPKSSKYIQISYINIYQITQWIIWWLGGSIFKTPPYDPEGDWFQHRHGKVHWQQWQGRDQWINRLAMDWQSITQEKWGS